MKIQFVTVFFLQIVLLGDHKQIRPIVQCALVKKMGMQQSLFERYMDLAIMLDTQYRMVRDNKQNLYKTFFILL